MHGGSSFHSLLATNENDLCNPSVHHSRTVREEGNNVMRLRRRNAVISHCGDTVEFQFS